jgi:PmbA protein
MTEGLQENKLMEICEKAAARIPRNKADQWEIFAARSVENEIDVFDQKIETLSFSDSTGIGIRIFRDRSIGYAYTAVLEDYAVEDAIDRAAANSLVTKKDALNYLPTEDDQRYRNKLFDHDMLYSKDFHQVSIGRKIEIAMNLEELTRNADKRITGVSDASYNDSMSQACIINSSGFSGNYSTTIAMVYAAAISRENGDTSTGEYFGIARDPARLDIKDVAINAAQRSTAILGGRKIRSGKMDIILDPMTSAQFLSVIASSLSADAVQKSKSLFKDKMGQKLFGMDIDIFDDGTLPEGLASRPFDGEGVIKGKTPVFKDGVLETFLYDTYTARKAKTLSTGNAVRASYRSTPSVGLSNFYISPGKHDPADMIGAVDRGFYIMDIIGLGSGTNPISGQMSVGAKGMMIEKGKLTHAVKEVTIAADILAFLSSFRMLGNDLQFVPGAGYMGSPSAMLENISISGK